MDIPISPGSSGNEDVNAKDKDDGTTLLDAALRGNTDSVKALIAAGADVNARDNRGGTALIQAALRGNTDCVKTLIAAGADVNAKEEDGRTALVWACLNVDRRGAGAIQRYEETIEALIAAGADVNAKGKDGQTALMSGDLGSTAAVKALIDAGADVNAKDNSGRTALMHMAARPDISAILRAAGARESPEPPPSVPIPGSNRSVFQTSEGGPHTGRIAGLIYVFILALECREFHVLEPSCLMWIMFVTGWWLAFCGKRRRPMSDPTAMIGVILIGLGLAGQFYFTGRH